MTPGGKIHFVHHLEIVYASANVGDWISSPYYYFRDYFFQYTCILHSQWAVLWHEIERDDIVIFGGGGILDNSDELNRILNQLIEKCDNVIIWGAGTHRYNENSIFGRQPVSVKINYDRAAIVGVRDFEHPSGLPYLPCVSCMNPAFCTLQRQVPITRTVGAIKSALEESFDIKSLPSWVTNAEPIGTIVKYILSSQIIITSSYHGAFWSMLMGKKVILPATRLEIDKYRYFRHPVGIFGDAYFDEAKLVTIADSLPEIPDFLKESRRLTQEFFLKCKEYIEERIEPAAENESVQIALKRTAQLEFTVVEMWNTILDLNHRISQLEK